MSKIYIIIGTLSVEGYILDKFDMKPHNENLENYGKLCRERTQKSMKSRKIQVLMLYLGYLILYSSNISTNLSVFQISGDEQ